MKNNHNEKAAVQEIHAHGSYDELDLVKQPFYELERHARVANERVRGLLSGLSKREMHDKINQLQLSDKSLNFLCEGIALEQDDHEISLVVEEIRKGRPINLEDDPIDHMNYTAL